MINEDAIKIMKHTSYKMKERMRLCQLDPKAHDHEELCHRVYEKLMSQLEHFDATKASLVTYANACVSFIVLDVCDTYLKELSQQRFQVSTEDCDYELEDALQQQRQLALQDTQVSNRLAAAIDLLSDKFRLLALMLRNNPKLTIKDLAEEFCMDYDTFHYNVWRKFCHELAVAIQKVKAVEA